MPKYVIETGAAAIATRARMDRPVILSSGQLLGSDSGVAILYDPEQRVALRFADEAAARQASVFDVFDVGHAASWPAGPRSFEIAVGGGLLGGFTRVAGSFDGVTGTVGVEEEHPRDGWDDPRGPTHLCERIAVTRDEWARFEHEVGLVAPVAVEAVATDLPSASWRLLTPEVHIETEGYLWNDEALSRAVDGLVGRTVLGGDRDFEDGSETLEDVEHMLLTAVRDWVSDASREHIDPASLRERDAESAVLERLTEWGAPASQLGVNGLMPDWPRVGRVDLALPGPDDNPVWIEWKWAKDASTLHNCLWDAAKVASGVRAGAASAGYLLTGAPDAEWARSTRGPTRLFDVGSWAGDAIVTSAQSWWTGWHDENQNTYPLRVPTPILTIPVGRARWTAPDEAPWTIKLVRVEAPGEKTFVPPPRS